MRKGVVTMVTFDLEEAKKSYINDIYKEMQKRGISEKDIPKVIAKTGFMAAIDEYTEVQLHYSIEDAVDEILLVAAQN